MSKAKDRALEAYPSTPNWDERITRMYRDGFIKGYHQAEKDLELTWEDIRRIHLIINSTINDVDMDNLTDKSIYQKVLKRFKEIKK